jgi:DMSO/TMAO reductase YedYZ heme-binding membrane subunit
MTTRFTATALALTLAYATLRYNVFGGIGWDRWPLFITNKAISWTSLVLFAAAYLAKEKARARLHGLTGFWLLLVHVVISFAILDEKNYAKIFGDGELTAAGWTSILAGTAGTLLFLVPALISSERMRTSLGDQRWQSLQQLGYIGLALTCVHLITLGVKGWIAPETWPGYLPPITLLSFFAGAAPLWRKLTARSNSGAASPEMR